MTITPDTLCYTVSFTPLLSEVGNVISPILQIRKPRLREVSKLGTVGRGGKTSLSLENSFC